jgi:hypothetical protein
MMLIVVCRDENGLDIGILYKIAGIGVPLYAALYIFKLRGINIGYCDKLYAFQTGKHFFMFVAHKTVADDTEIDI